jgi:hypothetical protein
MAYFRARLLAVTNTLTSKQIQDRLKSELNSYYANSMEYLKEHSNAYLKNFENFWKMEYFNTIFIELGYHTIDYTFDTLDGYNLILNKEPNEVLNHIICYIKNVQTNVNARSNIISKSIKILKTFCKEEEKLLNKIKSIDTTSEINCYFMIYAIDLLLNYFHTLLSQQQNVQVYSQMESFFDLIVNSSVLLLEITQYFFDNFQNIESKSQLSLIRHILIEPLGKICNFERAFDYYFQLSKLLLIIKKSIIIISCFI